LARQRGGVIVNADALQVYRELRILSARPTAEEEAEAPHRLYGHVSGAESYSVARWLAEATVALDDAWRDGLLPIVTGGTGLYFKVLEQGLAEIPPIAPDVREKWRSFAGDVHAALTSRDPQAAARFKPNDRQRIIRALEVLEGTGKPLAHWQSVARQSAVLAGAAVERIFVDVAREELYARAELRFDQMMAAGALEEARRLLGLDPGLPMMRAIGVPELSAYLRDELPIDETIAQAKTATRNYIKRQLTWWRGQMGHWRN
jgi:tRNA dimethylallyltransferase